MLTRRTFREAEPRRRDSEAAISWSFSPDSSEWAIRNPTKSSRPGEPRDRSAGCLSSQWRSSVELSVGVRQWLRERREASEQLSLCLAHHGQSLPRRLGLKDRIASPYRLAHGGLLVVSTWCHARGALTTTVHLKRKG
jgi:hypothetical protein